MYFCCNCIFSRLFFYRFLQELGVNIGEFLTKYISVLKEDLDDLHMRVDYLRGKGFTREDIKLVRKKEHFYLPTI